MAARIQTILALLVISLIVAVISLPMTALAAVAPRVTNQPLVSQGLRSPVRIAMNGTSGGYYVTDTRNHGVIKYNAAGKLLQVIRTAGIPQGIAVKSNGNLVVGLSKIQGDGSQVAIIDQVTGLEIRRLSPPQAFSYADGITIDDVGNIYVADAMTGKIKKFNSNGDYLSQFGSYCLADGCPDESFVMVSGLTFAHDVVLGQEVKYIVAADLFSGIAKFFDTNGVYKKQIGVFGQNGGLNFIALSGVAFDYTLDNKMNRMYMVDAYQSDVQVIDPNGNGGAGTFLSYIGHYGKNNGEFMVPSDVVYDSTNKRLLVANGYGNVTVFGIDGGKTPGSGSTAPPSDLTIDTPLSIVNTPSITLTGTVSATATVACALNGAFASYATVNGSTWSCIVNNLLQATNTIAATATFDQSYTATRSVNVKYQTPGPYLSVNPISVPPYVKIGQPLSVYGVVQASSTVQVNNTTNSSSVTCNVVDTAFTCPASLLVEGSNSISVVATNGGTTTDSYAIVFDNTAPTLTVSAVANNATVNGQVLNVTGTVTDDYLAGVTVNGKAAVVQALGSNNYLFSAPVVAATTVTVIASDLAGNASSPNTRNVNYDTDKSRMAVTSHGDGASVTTATQRITGTSSKTGTVSIGAVNGSIANGSWTLDITLAAGMNDLQIVHSDGSRTKLTLFFNASKPAISATTPLADTVSNATSYAVAGSIDTSVETVVLTGSKNGGAVEEMTSGIPVNLTLSDESKPAYVIFTATDGGNKSYAIRSILYDITPPALTINTPANPTTTMSGTVEAGATVVVKDLLTGNPVGTVSVTNTTWNASLGASRDPKGLAVIATDAAGNVSRKYSFIPDGNVNYPADLIVDGADVDICMNIIVGKDTATDMILAHGDIGPLNNGMTSPNGKIDIVDCILIYRKAAGLPVSW